MIVTSRLVGVVVKFEAGDWKTREERRGDNAGNCKSGVKLAISERGRP